MAETAALGILRRKAVAKAARSRLAVRQASHVAIHRRRDLLAQVVAAKVMVLVVQAAAADGMAAVAAFLAAVAVDLPTSAA